MSQAPAPIDFRANTQRVPPKMPAAVQKATTRFLGGRAALVEILGQDRWQELRQAGHDLRLHALTHLDPYLERAEREVSKAGGHVHWARDAAEANRILLQIARQHQVKLAVKSKSMVTEEIGLNHAMEAAGIRVLETDLGEYIVHGRRRTGASSAFHLSRRRSPPCSAQAQVDAPRRRSSARSPAELRRFVRRHGISGGNFLVAETGTWSGHEREGGCAPPSRPSMWPSSGSTRWCRTGRA
jgi:L-lactate dehydrogenase complex protein LldF